MDRHRISLDEVSLVWLYHCSLFLPASIRMWVSPSTSGIRRDEVSMSRLSVSDLQSRNNPSLIRSSCLRVSSSIIMDELRKAATPIAPSSTYRVKGYSTNLTDHSRW